jgi:hypothetical protein
MDSKAVIDYIREQINAGHSEAAVRQHLAAHGWPTASIHRAFEQYHRVTMPKPAALKRVKRRRPPIPRWTRRRVITLVVGLAVVAGVSVGVYTHWPHQKAKLSAAPPQAYSQRQSSDVVTLGGAVANYSKEHGKLPSYLSVTPDGTMILCGGDGCNSATDSVGALMTYNVADVHFAPYSPGLVTPDAGTLYMVPGALCKDNNTLGNATDKPLAMVILYLRDNNDGSVTSRCVKL